MYLFCSMPQLLILIYNFVPLLNCLCPQHTHRRSATTTIYIYSICKFFHYSSLCICCYCCCCYFRCIHMLLCHFLFSCGSVLIIFMLPYSISGHYIQFMLAHVLPQIIVHTNIKPRWRKLHIKQEENYPSIETKYVLEILLGLSFEHILYPSLSSPGLLIWIPLADCVREHSI